MELFGEAPAFTTPQWILAGIATVACVISVVTDLRTRRILNVVTLPAIVIGLLLHGVFFGWSEGVGMGLKWSVIGLLTGSVPFLIFVSINSQSFGMGDVKLAAALGALMGFPFMLDIFVRMALSGGVLAVVVLLWQGKLGRTLVGMLRRKRGHDAVRRDENGVGETPDEALRGKSDLSGGYPSGDDRIYIPYGVAIAAGALWAFVAAFNRSGMGNG